MIKLTNILNEIIEDNDKKYYVELIPIIDIEKYISKSNEPNRHISDIDVNKIPIGRIRRFFVGKYKDGSDIPTPYYSKKELLNNKFDTKVTLFTKEEAEKRKDFERRYAKNVIPNIKSL